MKRLAPERLRQWASETIAEVSDEVGSEKNGDYLLHYEGWSAFCLDDVLESLPPDADVEEELFDAAQDRSQGVIDEWVEENASDSALPQRARSCLIFCMLCFSVLTS